jgi:hypothetical protein
MGATMAKKVRLWFWEVCDVWYVAGQHNRQSVDVNPAKDT